MVEYPSYSTNYDFLPIFVWPCAAWVPNEVSFSPLIRIYIVATYYSLPTWKYTLRGVFGSMLSHARRTEGYVKRNYASKITRETKRERKREKKSSQRERWPRCAKLVAPPPPTLLLLQLEFVRRLDQGFEALLHNGSAFKRVPNLVGGLLDDIPSDEVVRQRREIFLLALPLAVFGARVAAGDDGERGVGTLDVSRGNDFVLGEGVGDEVFLELGLDLFTGLVGVAAVDAVFARAALE